MLRLAIPAAALAVCVPLSAQEDHFTSSPQGFEGSEGGMSIDLIGKEPLLRYQQVDAWTFGGKTGRNRIMFRRDGLMPTNPTYGARTIEMEFTHGQGNLGSMSTSFAANFAGTEQVVVTKKQLAFPDWSAAPAIPPQSQSAAMMIFTDVVGWGYPGKASGAGDFVWEVKVWSNDQGGTGYPMDADTATPTSVAGPAGRFGTPCTATGASSVANAALNITNFGTHFDMDLGVSSVEANQPAFFIMGATQVQANFGFCSPLEVSPDLAIALGNTDPTGAASQAYPGLTYNAALIGANIYGQGVVFDSGQGAVLTWARSNQVPVDPPTTSQVSHMWALDPNAATATSGIQQGGIILLTNHP